MKKLATIAAILAAGCAIAGVPVKWTVETSRADTQEVPCYHGETLDMEVTFKNYGQDLYVPTNVDAQIFWQTNGMSAFYWRTNNVTVVSNKMYATFLPEMDPGTVSCKGFVGVPGQIYRASFVLRFKNSPGLEPKILEWPYRELDFAKVEVRNAPYYEKDVVDQLIYEADKAATGEVARVLRAEIAVATPGDYQNVSNKAMRALQSESDPVFGSWKSGTKIVAGLGANAGTTATAIGPSANAGGRSSVAIGAATARDEYDIAIIGTARGGDSIALGRSSNAQYWRSVAIGYNCYSHGDSTINLGSDSTTANKVFIGSSTLKSLMDAYVPTSRTINGVPLTGNVTLSEQDPTVPDWAKEDNPPESMPNHGLVLTNGQAKTKSGTTITAANVGAYSAANGNTLATQVSTIGAHLNTEDARFVSTNYNSLTKMPEAYVEVKQMNQTTGSNEWLRVWSEMTRWNRFVGTDFDWTSWGGFHAWRTSIAEQIAQTSPKEYAFYDGVTGGVAPDGFFWIAQPRVAVCAGMGYQRYMDAGGTVWILESNGMVANVNGTTNGYFRISDEEGNSQFEIIKGDKQTVGATAYSMRSETVMGVVHRYVEYAVTNALAAPTAKFCRNLSSPTWIADTEANCPCNVTWTPGVNSYTLEFWPKATEPQMFVKAEYDRGGETRIKNSVPTEMQYIILNGTKYQLVPKTVGGELVMGLVAE